ncbi:TonB C-terminal domain-containing protein [Novosphingobium sp. FKTRR1]|uniref:TonB C-terminal domain-containing protein n=1 Tax=Novosphingobium sp. FKTRR1 TaxID=2879118 RepID=UPI001CF076F4|nr:TonB C-terminal domain-containing protein [Novosphingobium sp. FKTRR1]
MATRADIDDTRSGLTGEEALALVLAVAAHVALLAAFTLAPPGRSVQPPPERMTVTFADTVADRSLSPDPQAQPAPDVAPELGEPEPQPEPQAEPAKPEPAKPQPPQPAPAKPVPPKPVPPKPAPPKPVPPKPQPAPPKPQAAPAKPVPPKPAPPKPQAAPAKPSPAKPQAAPAKPAPAKSQSAAQSAARPADDRTRRRTTLPTGGSRIGDDFLHGIASSSNPGTARTPPADAVGPAPVAALRSAVSRQIKPRWAAPQGVDTDKLVTVLAWSLNPDGSLAGRPVVVSQSGITDENRAQAQRHAEQAIRAVQLAAPFDLPPQFYASWKRVEFRFDRKLSQ